MDVYPFLPQTRPYSMSNPPIDRVTNFNAVTLSIFTLGSTINTQFPFVFTPGGVSAFKFPYNATVFSMSLSSSIINSQADVAGIFLIGNNGETTLNLNGAISCYVPHGTLQSVNGPSSRTTVLPFGSADGIDFYQGSFISIYANGANNAGVGLWATATIFYSPQVIGS